jgi:cytoskeletal protein RodZ
VAHDGLPGGPPDDSGVEPTQYANYTGTGSAGYSESAAYSESYDQQSPDQYASPQPSRAWYQRPAALVGLGVLTAAMLALLIYAIVDFNTAEKPRQTITTVTATATTQAPTTEAPTTESPTTTTPSPAPTAVQPPRPSTTITAGPSVTTVTETTIERRFPRWPNRLNPPPLYEPPPG